ncbi:MAG: nuclear transport factor 2 family protein [Fimbriimonadaceae bacterium]
MNSRTLLAGLCTFVVFASASAESLRQVAERHEREFANAIKSKDGGWFDRVAAPDFREIDPKGKVSDRATSLGAMKQMFKMGKVTAISTKVLKVTGTAAQLVVLVDSHMTVAMRMNPKAKKVSKLIDSSRYQETWSKSKGKWHIHSLKTLTEHTTLDGKPFDTGM